MSSDDLNQSIDNADVSIIRDVLRQTGFQFEEPMAELDRIAARHAMELYQKGIREPDRLIAALSAWATSVSTARYQSKSAEISS
jgi:hypothetical protein